MKKRQRPSLTKESSLSNSFFRGLYVFSMGLPAGSKLQVRSLPSPASKIVAMVSPVPEVEVVATDCRKAGGEDAGSRAQWLHVEVQGTIGWIMSTTPTGRVLLHPLALQLSPGLPQDAKINVRAAREFEFTLVIARARWSEASGVKQEHVAVERTIAAMGGQSCL